jgi:hypothetical protein
LLSPLILLHPANRFDISSTGRSKKRFWSDLFIRMGGKN